MVNVPLFFRQCPLIGSGGGSEWRAGDGQLAKPGTGGHGKSPSRVSEAGVQEGYGEPGALRAPLGTALTAASSQRPLLFLSSMRNREGNYATK